MCVGATVGRQEHLFCLGSKPSRIIGLVENIRHAADVHEALEIDHRGRDTNGAHVPR